MNDYVLLELAKARQRDLLQEAEALRLAKLARTDGPRIRNRFSIGIRLLPQLNVARRVAEPAVCEC